MPVRPQVAHDLADGGQLQARGIDMFRALRLDVGAEAGDHRGVERRQIVGRLRPDGRRGGGLFS